MTPDLHEPAGLSPQLVESIKAEVNALLDPRQKVEVIGLLRSCLTR